MTNPKHTTEEYLAWIDERVAKLNELINNPCAWGIETEIEYRASLLANRDVLVRQKRQTTSLDFSTMSELKYEDGYNDCLAELHLDIAQRLDEVM